MELLSFRKDALRNVSVAYVIWLAMMLGVACAIYSYRFASDMDYVRPSVFLYFLIVAVHMAMRVVQGGAANLLAPDILFIAVYTMFHQGYLLLWALTIVPYSDFVFHYEATVPISLLIVNLGLIGAILGFELAGSARSLPAVLPRVQVPAPGWSMAGVAVMVLGASMHVLTLFAVGIGVFMQQGYTAVARLGEFVSGAWPMIWSRSVSVFLLGLTLYTISSCLRYRRLFGSRGVMILAICMFSLYVLEGDRGPVFLIGISLLLVRHYLIRPIKLRYVAGVVIGLMVLFTAMRVARNWAFSPGQMVAEFQHARATGEVHWWTTIAEAGGSFRIASIVAGLVPDTEPFWHGRSWLSAFAKIVPFLEGKLIGMGLLGDAPAQWITLKMGGRGAAGMGFSLPVEGYLNFGLPGVVVQMMIFGVIIRRVCVWFARRPSAFTALIMFGVLAPSIKVVRDHASLVVHVYAEVIVLAYLLKSFFGNEPEHGRAPAVMPPGAPLVAGRARQ